MKNNKKRLIFIIMYLAYMSIYLARINLSMAGTELARLKIADAAQIGLLGSFFFDNVCNRKTCKRQSGGLHSSVENDFSRTCGGRTLQYIDRFFSAVYRNNIAMDG